jgi:hypothetical protein
MTEPDYKALAYKLRDALKYYAQCQHLSGNVTDCTTGEFFGTTKENGTHAVQSISDFDAEVKRDV